MEEDEEADRIKALDDLEEGAGLDYDEDSEDDVSLFGILISVVWFVGLGLCGVCGFFSCVLGPSSRSI